MLTDILIVIRKEFKEFVHQRGSKRGTLIMIIIPLIVFGSMFPMMSGKKWVDSPFSLLSIAWFPLFIIIGIIADSFAGEKERHTLETLLASRLPDRAILFGKIGAAMSYSLIITAFIVFTGLITVNITQYEDKILIFPAKILFFSIIIGILLASLMSSVGVLVSMRAATVRQAHQTLSIGMIIFIFGTMALIKFIQKFIPHTLIKNIAEIIESFGVRQITIIGLGILFLVDIVLLAAAMVRFKRTRMILD